MILGTTLLPAPLSFSTSFCAFGEAGSGSSHEEPGTDASVDPAVRGIILLLGVDDVFTGPAGWISNRHAVIAMVFSVLCVWLYHLGVSRRKWPYIAGACGIYVLALLASEMGLVTFAYLFAYMFVLDRDKWLGRVKRIVPFILITVVWRLVYTGLGYGATGTLLYIDPILNPVVFIAQMLTRVPVLLFSAVGPPVVELIPREVAKPKAWASWSKSPSVAPGPT